MVNPVLSGLTPSYLSTYCSSSKRMITLWVKIADEQGFEALKPKKPTGRPAKLTEKQMKEIRRVLEEDDPKKYGQNVWDDPSLSAYTQTLEDTLDDYFSFYRQPNDKLTSLCAFKCES